MPIGSSDEAHAFNARSFEYLGDLPGGIPAMALVKQANADDLDEALFAIGLLHVWLADQQRVRVFQARAAGRSWSWIGSRLGLSRQALWERYRSPEERDQPPTRD